MQICPNFQELFFYFKVSFLGWEASKPEIFQENIICYPFFFSRPFSFSFSHFPPFQKDAFISK